jgi:CSLREA domain-containing protein
LIALAGAPDAAAASFTVTRFDDPPPDGCAPADCSLREAVLAANASPGPDSISVPAGHYRLSIPGPGEDAAATGDLDLTDDVAIRGAGARSTVVDAGGVDRVFDVAAGVQAELDGVTVTGGEVPGNGGGIRSLGVFLGLDGTALLDNRASGSGGGIEDLGRLLVSRSLIARNHAADGGGLHAGGADDLEDTTVAGNVAGGPGTTGYGGGIDGSGGTRLALTSVTLTGNQSFNAALAGAGVDSAAPVQAENTILADNVAHSEDQTTNALANCADPVTSYGHNLSDGTDCGLLGGGDQQGSPVLLGPLADNGGGTDTEAVLPGSLALGSGGGCSGTDQRGVTRPRGLCDVGAYEYAPPVVFTLAATAVAFSTATLNGSVDPSWHAATWYFEYGRTEQYGSRTPDQFALGNGLTPVSAPLTGLRQGATYHFRLVASGAEGTTMGDDKTFTTMDRTKPTLTLLRVVPGLFHRKNGATFAFTLSENATVTFRFDHSLRGVRRGKSCVKITRRNRRHRPCTRYLPVAGNVVLPGAEGKNSMHWDATVGAKLLTFGAYRLRATPKDPSGNVGKTVLAAFRVLR